jgi:lipoyl(octanoyl) transferase
VVNVRDTLAFGLQTAGLPPVEWRVSDELVPYESALAVMEARVAAIAEGSACELVWLLEHPPLYTSGTSAKSGDLIEARFPVHATGRGGQFTYHGPGQRIVYLILDLKRREPDVRRYVRDLEEWIIGALARRGVKGERRTGRVGIWVAHGGREDKIAAIGVRLRKWVTYHGISLNVAPDLSHYSGIVPCGIDQDIGGVTSLTALGVDATMQDADAALKQSYEEVFGPLRIAGTSA